MTNDKFIQDYVYYLKLHEEHRWSTEQRNAFWKQYRKNNNENK